MDFNTTLIPEYAWGWRVDQEWNFDDFTTT